MFRNSFRVQVKRFSSFSFVRRRFSPSRNLEKSVANQNFDEALTIFQKLAELTDSIHDTSVEHLRKYSADLTIFWYDQLKNVFAT